MTAEQLEELLVKALDDDMDALQDLYSLSPSLARRVIAAEKLQHALVCAFTGNGGWEAVSDASSAYHEASK